MDMSLSKLWEVVKGRETGVLQSMGPQRIRHNWATEQQGTKIPHALEQLSPAHYNQDPAQQKNTKKQKKLRPYL